MNDAQELRTPFGALKMRITASGGKTSDGDGRTAADIERAIEEEKKRGTQ